MVGRNRLRKTVVPMNKLRIAATALLLGSLFSFTGCQMEESKEPDFSNAQEVANLATFECTYHNVAKIDKESSKWWFIDLGDSKHEWFEYDATVNFGIDASLVDISSPDSDGNVVVTIPRAEVLTEPNVKAETMSDPISNNGWRGQVTDEERKEALKLAQQETFERAQSDDAMLAAARERAKVLLEQYVKNVGDGIGKTYNVKFVDTE